MEVATILPQAYLHLIKDKKYHMALCHMVGEKGYTQYTEFYKEIGNDPSKYLIMDNGEFEGEQQSIGKILTKAYSIKADEIILPDAYMNGDETILRTVKAYNKIKLYEAELIATYGYVPKLMIVPQGKTWKEYCNCLEILLKLDIDTVGIPKHLALEDSSNRLRVLDYFGYGLRGIDIHFLGCNEPLFMLNKIEQIIERDDLHPVRSIDSALPYVYAREGKRINEDERSHKPVNFRDLSTDPELLKQNIQYWEDIVMKGESKLV